MFLLHYSQTRAMLRYMKINLGLSTTMLCLLIATGCHKKNEKLVTGSYSE